MRTNRQRKRRETQPPIDHDPYIRSHCKRSKDTLLQSLQGRLPWLLSFMVGLPPFPPSFLTVCLRYPCRFWSSRASCPNFILRWRKSAISFVPVPELSPLTRIKTSLHVIAILRRHPIGSAGVFFWQSCVANETIQAHSTAAAATRRLFPYSTAYPFLRDRLGLSIASANASIVSRILTRDGFYKRQRGSVTRTRPQRARLVTGPLPFSIRLSAGHAPFGSARGSANCRSPSHSGRGFPKRAGFDVMVPFRPALVLWTTTRRSLLNPQRGERSWSHLRLVCPGGPHADIQPHRKSFRLPQISPQWLEDVHSNHCYYASLIYQLKWFMIDHASVPLNYDKFQLHNSSTIFS